MGIVRNSNMNLEYSILFSIQVSYRQLVEPHDVVMLHQLLIHLSR